MPQAAPHAPIPDALATVVPGRTCEYGGLAVTPLLGDDAAAGEYLTLDEALAAALVEIAEVSESGRIPELRVRNGAAQPVLIVDGEELVGAKQNRVINVTVLVAARNTMTIPVSCVEARRWSRQTERFAAAPRTHFASGRAEKMAQVSESLSSSGTRDANQVAIWDSIAVKSSRMQTHSDTGAMAALFERHATPLDQYVEHLAPLDRQRGAIFSLHGRPAGLELFDRAHVWRRLMPKLIRSYALDAVDATANGAEASFAGPQDLLAIVAAADSRTFPAIGEGQDVRLTGRSLGGAALVQGGRVVHLAAFASNGRPPRRMSRVIVE